MDRFCSAVSRHHRHETLWLTVEKRIGHYRIIYHLLQSAAHIKICTFLVWHSCVFISDLTGPDSKTVRTGPLFPNAGHHHQSWSLEVANYLELRPNSCSFTVQYVLNPVKHFSTIDEFSHGSSAGMTKVLQTSESQQMQYAIWVLFPCVSRILSIWNPTHLTYSILHTVYQESM